MKSPLLSPSRLGITVRLLRGALATVTVTLIGFEVTVQILALSESVLARHGGYDLNAGLVGMCLTITGALMVLWACSRVRSLAIEPKNHSGCCTCMHALFALRGFFFSCIGSQSAALRGCGG